MKANVLIDENGRARLTDFGLLAIVSDLPQPTFSTTLAMAGTIGWTSPELLDPDQFGMKDSQPTKKSDCYALGMTILEVLSGQVPFAPFRNPAIMQKVIKGRRPRRPKGMKGEWFTDDLWGTLEQCWLPQAEDRPNVEAVLKCLEGLSATWKSPPPGVGDDVQEDSNYKSRSTASHIRTPHFALSLILIVNHPLQRISQSHEYFLHYRTTRPLVTKSLLGILQTTREGVSSKGDPIEGLCQIHLIRDVTHPRNCITLLTDLFPASNIFLGIGTTHEGEGSVKIFVVLPHSLGRIYWTLRGRRRKGWYEGHQPPMGRRSL